MTKNEAVTFWLRSAKENLATAKAMLVSKRWNFAMFMCQQTIEALLKAIYVHKKHERPPYIHRLPQLADLAEVDLPDDIDRKMLEIDAHYLKARYFTDRFDRGIYNRKRAAELFQHAQEVYRWLMKDAGLKNS